MDDLICGKRCDCARDQRPINGAASSLIGCMQQTVAASTGALVAHALGATAWPLVIGIAVPGTAALAIWAATRRVRERAIGSGHGRD
jgi:hypothetical protein